VLTVFFLSPNYKLLYVSEINISFQALENYAQRM